MERPRTYRGSAFCGKTSRDSKRKRLSGSCAGITDLSPSRAAVAMDDGLVPVRNWLLLLIWGKVLGTRHWQSSEL